MEYDTKAIVHAEFCDHRSTNRQSATMEYHNIQRGLPAMKDLQVEEIVSDASSVIKAALGTDKINGIKCDQNQCHNFMPKERTILKQSRLCFKILRNCKVCVKSREVKEDWQTKSLHVYFLNKN